MRIDTPAVLKALAFGLGGLALGAAAVELARTEPPEVAAPATPEDPRRDALARCRDLAPEGYGADRVCRTAWDAERRRFLGLPARTE